MKYIGKGVLLLATLWCTSAWGQSSVLTVNEVMVGNIDVMIDPSYNYGGWVEVYNPGSSSVNMGNMYVSDDAANLKKFRLSSSIGSVAAGGFKTLWFDHYSTSNEYSSEAYKQIDFKLNPEGGSLYISSSDGTLIVNQDYPPMVSRASYARTTDGGSTWRYCSTPTPASSNNGSTFADQQLEMPTVDRSGTVFTDAFKLHVTIPQGTTLRYTTDGTTPTLTVGATSADGTFSIDKKNYVFRFRLFRDGWLPSPVATHTYIYNNKGYYLPVVSVVTDSKNLYDSQIGAYVDGSNGIGGNGGNGNQNSNKNRSWERPVNFEYLVPDNDGHYHQAVNQETDFEVSGGWSRHFRPAASFKLKSDKRYEGKNFYDYPLFQSKPYIKNKAFIVRNGGNDTNCRIFDAGIHEILRTSGYYIDCQAWQPAHIFINGTYQFMFNLRETNNKNFGYSNYGIDKDDMDQFEYNGTGYRQMTGDNVAFKKWVSLAKQLASQPSSQDLWQQICDLVDVDEFCNYMAAECYVGSRDWLTGNNNAKGFRSRQDGRFHIVFMDVDEGFAMNDMLNNMNSGSGNELIATFANMLKHQGFRRQFIDTYCVVAGSIFDPDRATTIITRMADYMTPALALDGKNPWDIQGENWSNHSMSGRKLLEAITNEGSRKSRISTLRNYFSLGNAYDVTISSNLPKACIKVNGVQIPTGQLKGSLFVPVTLTAETPAGYRFVGWQLPDDASNVKTVFGTTESWTYYDQGSLDGQNWTSPTYATTTWSTGQAPFGYGNITGATGAKKDYNTTLDYGPDSNNKRPTYYMRRQFTLDAEPTADHIYQLHYYVDDGCVIYINGKEVERYLMPSGTITYNQYSTTYVENDAYHGTFNIDNSLLHAGTNTIAVEVHNTNATSSDSYWTAMMTVGEVGKPDTNPQLKLETMSTAQHHTIKALYEPIADKDIQFDGRSLIVTADDTPYAPVRINEVSASNSIYVNEYYKKNDWIELYNTTDMDIDVAGLYITDNPDKLQKFQITAGVSGLNTVIPAHGHLVIWADKLTPAESDLAQTSTYENLTALHTGFKLGNSDEQTVILTSSEEFVNANPLYFKAHPDFAKGFADQIIYDTHEGDQSVGRYPDGSNSIYLMHRSTIALGNTLHTYDQFLRTDKGLRGNGAIMTVEDVLMADHKATSGAVIGVYTVSGLYVAADTRHLQPGLYVVKYSDGHSRKLLVR